MNMELRRHLENFKNRKVVVWGDLILDEYIYTSTSRISREAPVLVTEFEANDYKLGGAGNVIMNIKALGADPVPVGLVGNDADGRTLEAILTTKGISTQYLVKETGYKTPKKSRILSGGDNTKKQQVLRIDTLNKIKLDAALYEKLESNICRLLETTDLLILSDYLYESVKPEIFQNIKTKYPNKLYIVDSRKHFLKFGHVSIATPNEPEIKKIFPDKLFYSEDDFHAAGHELMEKLDAKGIILKRGHKGMLVFERDASPRPIDIFGSADIVDVTGAGDTVISVLGLGLLSGADLYSSAQLANIAAGYVVMKEGAYPISSEELNHVL